MDEHNVFSPEFLMELPDCLDEMKSFDISYSTSNFYDGNIALCSDRFDSILDLIGDMRDDLDGFAEIITPSLFLYDGEINLS